MHYFSGIKLPREAQEGALNVPMGVECLSHNPFLDADIVKTMVERTPSTRTIEFLTTNLSATKALAALRCKSFREALRTRDDFFTYPEAAISILAALNKRPLSKTAHQLLLKAEVPTFSNFLLGSSLSSFEDKRRTAKYAYRAVRAYWLSSEEALALPAGEVVALLEEPETFENVYEHSMFDDSVKRNYVETLTYLFLKRPDLHSWASRKSDPSVLLALSRVPSDQETQLQFIETYTDLLSTKGANDLNYFYRKIEDSTYSDSHATPVTNLVSSPWATQVALELIEKNPELYKVSFKEGNWVKVSDYAWGSKLLFEAEKTPRCDITTASPETVASWLKQYCNNRFSFEPVIAYLALGVKGLSRSALNDRLYTLKSTESFRLLLNRDRKRQLAKVSNQKRSHWAWEFIWGQEQKKAEALSFEKLFPEANLEEFLDVFSKESVQRIKFASDGALGIYLSNQGLSSREWEVVFTLLDNFQGSCAELVEAAKYLS